MLRRPPSSTRFPYPTLVRSGSEAVEVKRVVRVVDTTGPVITLVGSAAKTVEAKSVYIDEGATAIDTLDGALVVTSVSKIGRAHV